MRFRVREGTTALHIIIEDTGGLTSLELDRMARRRGEFGVPYHYLIQKDGTVEEGREVAVIGGFVYDETRQAIIILVDSLRTPTDSQKVSLRDLKESILGTYPDLKVIWRMQE